MQVSRHQPSDFYEWAGGQAALDRLTEAFYTRVRADEVLAPVFAQMPDDHPHHVALWLAEVFGGPPRYTDELGGYPRMMGKHLGRALTEAQRSRWVVLIGLAADDAALPADPEFGPRSPPTWSGARGSRGQLAAGRRAATGRAGPPVGLGRGAAVPSLSGSERGTRDGMTAHDTQGPRQARRRRDGAGGTAAARRRRGRPSERSTRPAAWAIRSGRSARSRQPDPAATNRQWESRFVFNPAAVVKNGLMQLLYRAQGADGARRSGSPPRPTACTSSAATSR